VVIEAVGLTKSYGNAKAVPAAVAVDRLDLAVPAGELFAFLGENGAGKTTTIKMLTGLIPPTAGAARIGGHDLRTEPLPAKRLVGYVPDNPFLYERLTGNEFLRFMGDLYSVPPGPARDRRAADLLALFDLSAKADAPIGGYSRGMRQKIALAAALLHEPRALFLDEPTVGLDPKSTRRLQDVLRTVAARGVAVFLSTHVLEVAAGLCDRIGILHRGRLVALGTPDRLTEGGSRTLEEVFLALTGGGAAGAQDEVARLLGGVEGSVPERGEGADGDAAKAAAAGARRP
jgi:ABC-2 type transport system ATP-binding protein